MSGKEFTKRRMYRESRFFSTFPRQGEGWVCRYVPALRDRVYELLLDYNWVKKVSEGVAVGWPLGCWGVVTPGFSLFQCRLLPVAARSG